VLIGNKSGRQAIRVRQVVDATEQGLVEHLVGALPNSMPDETETLVVSRTMAFMGVAGEGVR
jgi:hypothetical protein